MSRCTSGRHFGVYFPEKASTYGSRAESALEDREFLLKLRPGVDGVRTRSLCDCPVA
jgi:hypothetical protein